MDQSACLENSFYIRKLEESDLSALLTLYQEISDSGDNNLSWEVAKVIFQRIQTYPDYVIYVAVSGENIIGTFALLVMDNLTHNGSPSGVVESVIVRSDWQGQGVGRKMMQFAQDYCREKRCYKMTLSSNIKRHQAHRFYESLGFEKHGYSFLLHL